MADLTVSVGLDAGEAEDGVNMLAGNLSDLEQSVAGAAGSFEALSQGIGVYNDVANAGDQRADDLARAQSDVARAALDVEQATRDAAQSQQDINQAQRDGAQSGIDLEQALLDQKVAQQEYNAAVKEFGAGSVEARQASIDLKQADEDARQAKEDGKQAILDQKQAVLDGKSATLDAKDAQLDLNQAQRDQSAISSPLGWVQWAADLASGVLGVVALFAVMGTTFITTAATAVATAATTAAAWVAAWVTMAARSLASAARMAAAWLIAMGPVGLVIAIVVGLVALIIANWQTVSRWTVRIWNAVWGFLKGLWRSIVSGVSAAIGFIKNIFFRFHPLGIIIANWGTITRWIKDQWDSITRLVSGAVKRIGGFFGGMWDGITKGLRSALNGAIGLINGAIGGINTLISGANRVPGIDIPFIPYIPYLAAGGITTGPTMAMIGEGREQEAVLPLSKLQGLIDMGNNGGRPIVLQINGGGFREFLQENVRAVSGGDIVKYAGGA
jgi:hypothetical protein